MKHPYLYLSDQQLIDLAREQNLARTYGYPDDEVLEEIIYRFPEYRHDPFWPLVDTARFPWTPGTGTGNG